MRAFACPHCHRQVFFENTQCLHCGTASGFDPRGRTIVRAGTYCANRQIAGCNWLVERDGELGLPVDGVAFDLLSSAREPVTTGHADGVITLDLAESDDAHRERMREEMGEPYRTVLGHLRHEIGHYYWPILADDDTSGLPPVRGSATTPPTTRPRSSATTSRDLRPAGRTST